MKTKIVYCLISDDNDYYYEQLLISLYSLRKHNPDAVVELVIDNDTNATLVNKRTEIYSFVTRVVHAEVPKHLSKKQRSRFIKTNLRNLISGDYLFLDTDTIIQSSLEDIDEVSSDICATQEYNELNRFTKKDPHMRHLAEKVGLADELENEPYFNSGVMYVKDTPKAHLLYELWHSYWLITLSRGLNTDQTPLCWANKKAGHVIDFLDDKWNCLVKLRGIEFEENAKIIHYACEHSNTHYILSVHSIFDTMKMTGTLIPTAEYLIDNPSTFLVNAFEERFLRESTLFQILFKHHRCVFLFLRWIALNYLRFKNFLERNMIAKK